MKNIGFSYINIDKDDIDINICLEIFRLKFGIKLLLLEGRNSLNDSFIKAGVIDEISFVY